MDYNYPLDYNWSTEEIIDVIEISHYSIYQVVKAAKENDWIQVGE